MPISSQINSIDPTRPVVALTFDDGPGIYTSRILDTLQQHGGRVSFFVMGSNINEHKNKIFRAMQMDCDVICHAWDHSDLTQLSGNAIKKQLADTIAAIETITGKAPPMFRPPHGFVNKKVLKISRKLGLATVFWSVDPMDWMVRDADAVYSYIMENVKDEDIVLCHDVHETTAVAMSRVIPQLIAQGYQLVTVTQLLTKKYGKIIPGEMYCKLS